MAITSDDVKLMESQRMSDTPDGGGRMTGNEVIGGQINNVFPDISRLDRTYGDVALRKLYPAVLTPDRSVYYGAHVILTEPPSNDDVNVTLFTTGSYVDKRVDARNRIESYVVRGPDSGMVLYGDQLEGQRTITALLRESDPLPEVGEVLALYDSSAGIEQYVRIQEVSAETRTFSEVLGGSTVVDFERVVVTLSLSNALRYQFGGGTPNRVHENNGSTEVRTTNVAQAARYYGVSRIAAPVAQDDLSVQAERVYAPLVPATQGESPVTDVPAGELTEQVVDSGGYEVTIQDVAKTAEIVMQQGNRQYVYVQSLYPLPAPGTVRIAYRALGRWETLRDDGAGGLTGAGSGTVQYDTGSVTVTLEALPDVDTSIIYSWGTPAHYVDRAGSGGNIAAPRVTHTVAAPAIEPGSLTVTWLTSGAQQIATDDGAGNLTGDATGRVIYATGEIGLAMTALPDANTELQIDYRTGTAQQEAPAQSVSAGLVTVQASHAPLKLGSVAIEWQCTRYRSGGPDAGTQIVTKRAVDDGAGALVDADDGSPVAQSSVDYAAGTITFDPTEQYQYRRHAIESASSVGGFNRVWQTITEEDTYVIGSTSLEYIEDSATFTAQTETTPSPPAQLALTPLLQDTIVPGSLRFSWAGDQFLDRQGTLYRSVDQSTGAGLAAGSINYETGEAIITDYPPGASAAGLSIDSMVTRYGNWVVDRLFFRTPGAPLRPGGFYIQATTPAGDLLEATADANGHLSDTLVDGEVDQETGVVRVMFGEYVDDASLTSAEKQEPWYDPANVQSDGTIWRPQEILPSSARFNAVIYTTLPLDADLLGLDPVRLPQDGRVPIFHEGGVVVLHNTQQDQLPSGLTAGEVVQLSRTGLSSAELFDQQGLRVPSTQYTVDPAAGTITMTDPLDLSGLTEPLIAYHRIEDMLLVSDVQINGTVTFVGGVQHDYPIEGTYLSSALLYGDLQARVVGLFSQDAWTGEWSDERIGDNTTAQYNAVDYPIEVTNEGAIKERWALIFETTETFRIVGETVGQIGLGYITQTTEPVNAAAGVPYFRIDAAGWGAGWQPGNVVRFNTEAANAPLWVARTVLPSDTDTGNDDFRIQIRGDAN